MKYSPRGESGCGCAGTSAERWQIWFENSKNLKTAVGGSKSMSGVNDFECENGGRSAANSGGSGTVRNEFLSTSKTFSSAIPPAKKEV